MSKLPFIIMLALLLAGCLELEQKIVVAADGSAVFTYIYDIPNCAATSGRPKTTAR